MCWYYMAITSVVSASLTASSFADEADSDSAENVIAEWVDTFNKNDPEKHLEFYERSDNMEVSTCPFSEIGAA